MKKAYFILILIISSELSNQFQELPPSAVRAIKCIFGSKEHIESLNFFVETVFSQDNFFNWLASGLGLAGVLTKCLNIDIIEILKKYLVKGEEEKASLLNNLQKANAPILLRKHLYDLVAKDEILKAIRNCYDITKMTPYDKYQNICNLFVN